MTTDVVHSLSFSGPGFQVVQTRKLRITSLIHTNTPDQFKTHSRLATQLRNKIFYFPQLENIVERIEWKNTMTEDKSKFYTPNFIVRAIIQCHEPLHGF